MLQADPGVQEQTLARTIVDMKRVISMSLSDLLVESSSSALNMQLHSGAFEGGWNGPYHDTETPVRNTAHWLITLLKAYELSNNKQFVDAAWRAAQYLTTKEARPMKATFFCRTNPNKDFSNGLIGQAWAIEGLVAAAHQLGEQKYLDLARDVFAQHPFDDDVGLWRVVNVDGSYSSFDMTLNHQLMFAAAGAMLDGPDGKYRKVVEQFLDRVNKVHLCVADDGRIIHFVPSVKQWPLPLTYAVKPVRKYKQTRTSPYMVHKEIGYHAFNLYAFSLLQEQMPHHPLWKTKKFEALLHFVNDSTYVRGLDQNKYAYPYNPAGFEVACALQAFAPLMKSVVHSSSWWINMQIQRCLDTNTMMMSKDTLDSLTLSARLYEATRLQDVSVVLMHGGKH